MAFRYVFTVSHGLVSAFRSVTVIRSSSTPGPVNRMRSLTVIASLWGVNTSMNELVCSATVSTTSAAPSLGPVGDTDDDGWSRIFGVGLRPSRYTRRSASFSSLKNVILSFVCMTSMPYAMLIMAGMPGGRHLALLSNWYDPAIRDFRIISHCAMYSGLSDGASGDRPCDPSESGADVV